MITHDRWQQIKEIFYSAQDRAPAERSAFINEVCGDDVSMREEVEALLTADAGNENFLSSPAYEFAAGMLASQASEFAAGQTVGRYEILCSLGAGGMGQIYLARDAQLGRNIALKLISQEFAADPRRVLRFEQEARAASALNHPNVCVIHEIGTAKNGRHFIAMEYIQGVTLRDHLAHGPLKLLDALQIGIQVGAALASAHAVGIVHRDIKPENIMLRPDGYVKVVDFGLAKLTEFLPEQWHLSEAQTVVRTEPHTLIGTVKYMSPEQLRETPVDERTDIWSLGIVLYEMLTGVTPFDARSRNDSVALILEAAPAQLSFPDDVPAEFREIVKKALEKDAAERYQTITKLTSDLSSLKRKLERTVEGELTNVPGVQSPPLYRQVTTKQDAPTHFGSAIFTRLKSQAILTADSLFSEIRTHKAAALFAGGTGVLALLLVLPGVARWINERGSPVSPVQQTTSVDPRLPMKPLTNAGRSVCSAISSDGKQLAHVEEQNGKQRLVVTNLTTFASGDVVAPAKVQYLGVSFSQDANYLYFTRREEDGQGILYSLALPGSNPTKLKTGVDSPVSFSPNGDRFAFVRRSETAEFQLIVSNVDGTNEQVVASRNKGERLSTDAGAAWSPDGNILVCPASFWNAGFHTDLVAFNLQNEREQVIGNHPWFSIMQVAWQDDMTSLVVSARETATAPHQLWRVRFPDGNAQRITTDLYEYSSVSLHDRDIVAVRATLSWDLWVTTPNDAQTAATIRSGEGWNYGVSWTSTGQIVFSSMAQDRLNVFRINPHGANQVQLTTGGDNYLPASSPDGRYIVFASNRNGPFNIWRSNAEDGSETTQLTFGDGNFYPSVSPDGQWVVYDNVVDAQINIWKVPLKGGAAVKVAENCRMPVFSPDSQFIACRSSIESTSRYAAIFSAQGGPPLQQFEIPIQEWQRLQWLPNGRELTYLDNKNGYSNIWSYNLDTRAAKQLTNFNSNQIYAYAWSPDYKQVACQRGTRLRNVTMISER